MHLRHVVARPLAGSLLASGFQHITAVQEVCPAGAVYGPQQVGEFALFATEAGTATACVNQREVTHRAGTLVATLPDITLREEVGAEGWQVDYLVMRGAWPDSIQQTVRLRAAEGADAFPFPGAYYSLAPLAWRNAVHDIVRLVARDRAGDDWLLLGRLTELFAQITVHPPNSVGAPDTLFAEAELLLEHYPERCWSVSELAAALHTSPRQLTYRVKQATGLAPAEWMRKRRVQAARRLLAEGQSVTEVANQLGYANPYHFSRVFKATTGQTPSQARHPSSETALHRDTLHRKSDA